MPYNPAGHFHIRSGHRPAPHRRPERGCIGDIAGTIQLVLSRIGPGVIREGSGYRPGQMAFTATRYGFMSNGECLGEAVDRMLRRAVGKRGWPP